MENTYIPFQPDSTIYESALEYNETSSDDYNTLYDTQLLRVNQGSSVRTANSGFSANSSNSESIEDESYSSFDKSTNTDLVFCSPNEKLSIPFEKRIVTAEYDPNSCFLYLNLPKDCKHICVYNSSPQLTFQLNSSSAPVTLSDPHRRKPKETHGKLYKRQSDGRKDFNQLEKACLYRLFNDLKKSQPDMKKVAMASYMYDAMYITPPCGNGQQEIHRLWRWYNRNSILPSTIRSLKSVMNWVYNQKFH